MVGSLPTSITSTSISIQWTVTNAITATGYTISYSNTDNTECFTDSNTVTDIDGSTDGYTIGGLEEGAQYTITVAIEGRADDDTVIQATQDAGNTLHEGNGYAITDLLFSSSICCSYFCESICSDLLQHHCPVGGSELH